MSVVESHRAVGALLASPGVIQTLQGSPAGKPTPDYKAKMPVDPQRAVAGDENFEIGRWRKRDLDEIRSRLFSPLNEDQIPYGGNPVTDRVIQFRREHRNILEGRNVSLVLYRPSESESGGYVIAATRGRMGEFPHAEMIALDKLPSSVREQQDRIRAVYSERKPCGKGCGHRDCSSKIALVAGRNTKVLYSFKNDPEARKGILERLSEAPQHDDPHSPAAPLPETFDPPDFQPPQGEDSDPAEYCQNLSSEDVDALAQTEEPESGGPAPKRMRSVNS
jgi:hypothetical protein